MADPMYGGNDPEAPDHESGSMMTDEPPQRQDRRMKVDSITIRPATNGGFVLNVSRVQKVSAGGPTAPYESHDYVFKTFDEASAFLASELEIVV